MTVRQYGPAWIAAELLAWILFPVGLLWMAYDRLARWAGSTPQKRAERMVRWYPPAWRDRHGAEFAALLQDAAEAGDDGPRLWLDVAREAAAVRLQASVSNRRGWLAGALWTLGIVVTLPLTIVPLVLGRDGIGDLVVGAGWAAATVALAVGLALIAASLAVFRSADRSSP